MSAQWERGGDARGVGREAQGAVWRLKIRAVVQVRVAGGYMNPVSPWSPSNSEQSDVFSLSLDRMSVRLRHSRMEQHHDKIKKGQTEPVIFIDIGKGP